jgi:AcrR family transcriptional regulator
MPANASRQRLLQAALDLFIRQGVASTTTRQIAEVAEVNEVTLFRQFGNKQGLLLAVVQESEVFQSPEEDEGSAPTSPHALRDYLQAYASDTLKLGAHHSALLRALIGEADLYPSDLRQALADRLALATKRLVARLDPQLGDRAAAVAEAFHSALMGRLVLEMTTAEADQELGDRHPFIADLVQSLSGIWNSGAILHADPVRRPLAGIVAELPDEWAHRILERSRKGGVQSAALAYVLLGAGLSAQEVMALRRSDVVGDRRQSCLQVTIASQTCSIPLNQWILGRRYGSPDNNPLTKWLKQRKDSAPDLFLDPEAESEPPSPLTLEALETLWQSWTEGLLPGELRLEQTQQTWCLEMVQRGMSLENLTILTGWQPDQLQPYLDRARVKTALEQAHELDRKARG